MESDDQRLKRCVDSIWRDYDQDSWYHGDVFSKYINSKFGIREHIDCDGFYSYSIVNEQKYLIAVLKYGT